MNYRVIISQAARVDLFELDDWISAEANETIASRYVDRIEQRIAGLADFPNRGSLREEIGPGVRSLPFERRIIIFYRVTDTIVDVLRVVSGARSIVDPAG